MSDKVGQDSICLLLAIILPEAITCPSHPFREMNLIEQWGTGVPRMFKQAEELGLPEPQIAELGMRVRLVVYLAEQVHVEINKLTQQVTQQVTQLLEKIEGEMSRSQLMQALQLKDRVNFSRMYLEPALALNLIEMTQPDSPKSPTQKYRLTAKADRVLGNNSVRVGYKGYSS